MRVTAGLLVAWALMTGLSDARTAAKPNLKVATVRTATTTVVAGAKFSFTDTTSNTGAGKAARSRTGFFLSADRRKDSRDRRIGGRAVPALKKGKRSKRASSVGIPAGQAAGTYRLIVCADERRKLREAKESDNCRVAAGAITVTRRVVPPPAGTQPAAGGGDQPPPATGTPVPSPPATDPFDGFAQPTAFRFTDLDLRDPHVFINFLGVRDITDNGIGAASVNSQMQSSLTSDGDGDGYLDRSPVNLFRPLGQAAATSPAEVDFGAQCTATATITCSPGVTTSALATNQSSGICLGATVGTTTAAYAPEVTQSSSPCFSTAATTLTFNLAGIPVTLKDAQVGATYVGAPATSEANGLIRGFITETDANNTIIPANVALVGGQPLSSLLPGGQNCPAAHDDRDVHNGVTGWWFYLNFTATQTAWEE